MTPFSHSTSMHQFAWSNNIVHVYCVYEFRLKYSQPTYIGNSNSSRQMSFAMKWFSIVAYVYIHPQATVLHHAVLISNDAIYPRVQLVSLCFENLNH